MPRLLINADDFGLHKSVNDSIAVCVENGIVNSVSVLTNGRTPDYQRLHQFTKQGVFTGLHIGWVGEPLLSTDELIKDWKTLCLKWLTGGRSFQNVLKREAEMQVSLLIENGITPDHIDSHQHVHHLPGLWEMTEEIRSQFNIPRIRVAKVSDRSLCRKGIGGMGLQSMAARKFKEDEHYYCAGIRLAGNYDPEEIVKEIRQSSGHNTELIVHPGSDNSVLNKYYSDWHFDWEREFNSLLLPEFKKCIDDSGFVLDRKTSS